MDAWTEFVQNGRATDRGVHVYTHADELAGAVGAVADSEKTLDALLVDGRPSRQRFEAAVGSLLDRVAELVPYRLDVFDRATQTGVLPRVCEAHTHVLPAADVGRLERAVDAAFGNAFGDGGATIHRALDAHAGRAGIPRAQLALMWISEQAPKLSEQVLRSARAHYERAAPAV